MKWGSSKRDDAPLARNRLDKLASFLVAALLALTFLTFPEAPPDNDVDSSLGGVLDYAHQHRTQFGTDLAFTYGPLGHLMFYYSSVGAIGWRMAITVALCGLVATGLCLVAWRLHPALRWLLVLLFFWIAPNVPTSADFLIYLGLCCWGLLCFVASDRHLPLYGSALGVLAAFGALAKISFLFVGFASVAAVVSMLAIRERRRWAVAIAVGVATAFILGWMGSGQKLWHLGAYFANGLAVVEAYNGALGWEGPASVRLRLLLLAPLVLCVIVLRIIFAFDGDEKRRGGRRGLLLVWILALTFSVWKYGCVRAGRETVLLGFISLLVWVLAMLPCGRPAARGWALGIGLVVCLASLVTMQQFFFLSWPDSLKEPFRAFGRNVIRLANPSRYRREMEDTIAVNHRAAHLSRLRTLIDGATTDVFGQCQAYALLNDLNYTPRPVFQSYVACSRPLMELNERFYQSKQAPEYVLFRLRVLDRKFPPMEDGLVLRLLLANYRPIAVEDPFVLLKAAGNNSFAVSPIHEGTARLGEAIDLRDYGDADLWLEISLEPTWLGRLRKLLYRPSTVRLAVWREPGGKLFVRHHAPAQMLAAGFLASPLLLDNQDVLNLYTDGTIKRPGAYSVEVPSAERWCWQDSLRFRISKVDNRLGRCVPHDAAAVLFQQATNAVLSRSTVSHDFRLFRPTRWRPDTPAPGSWEETLTFVTILATPFLCASVLMMFFRLLRRNDAPTGWNVVVIGNVFVLLFLASTAFLVAEIYFRFFYDTTDSLAFTKTTERWVQRHWRQNNTGCRDNMDYSPAIEPGSHRITFVGDSFTAGHGIKNVEDRFPNLLRQTHPSWDVQTLASVGLDTGGELALMKKAFAKGYQADQVVLVYCLNDIGDLLPADADVNGEVLAKLDNSGWLVRNSYAVNLWYFHYQASRIPSLRDYGSFLRDTYNSPLWEQQKQRLKEFRDLVRSHGGHLAVVTFPFLHKLGPNYEFQSVHEKLAECWHELDVPELDLLAVYNSFTPPQVTVNRYDAHPNEFANKLAANAIDKWLAGLDAAAKSPATNSAVAP